MATVRVVSALVNTDSSENEEFYAETATLDLAVTAMLDNERKVAHEDWLAWVSYNSGFYFDEGGFTFTIYDDGSGVNYRYVFTT